MISLHLLSYDANSTWGSQQNSDKGNALDSLPLFTDLNVTLLKDHKVSTLFSIATNDFSTMDLILCSSSITLLWKTILTSVTTIICNHNSPGRS